MVHGVQDLHGAAEKLQVIVETKFASPCLKLFNDSFLFIKNYIPR